MPRRCACARGRPPWRQPCGRRACWRPCQTASEVGWEGAVCVSLVWRRCFGWSQRVHEAGQQRRAQGSRTGRSSGVPHRHGRSSHTSPRPGPAPMAKPQGHGRVGRGSKPAKGGVDKSRKADRPPRASGGGGDVAGADRPPPDAAIRGTDKVKRVRGWMGGWWRGVVRRAAVAVTPSGGAGRPAVGQRWPEPVGCDCVPSHSSDHSLFPHVPSLHYSPETPQVFGRL